MKNQSSRHLPGHSLRRDISSILLGSAIACTPAVHAASATWNGTTSNLWATDTNWSATPVPGPVDTATFDNAGNGNTTIHLGAGVTVKTLLFDASAASYTLGSGAVGSQTLTLANAGAITVNAGVTNDQLFSAGVVLGTDGTAQTATLTNESLDGTLRIAGGITGSTGTGAKVLAVAGAGASTISGNIVNGSSGTVRLTKAGTGNLLLAGSNTFTGTTTLTGGTLSLGSPDALKNSAVTVGNGTTLGLRNNSNTTFNTNGAVALSNVASQSVTVNVNNLDAGTGKTLKLANGISYNAPSITTGTYTTTLNVTGGNDYALEVPTLNFTNANSYGTGSPRNFVLALNPTTANVSVGALTVAGSGSRVTVALTLGGTSLRNEVTGILSLPSTRPVTKNGTGTWTLSGANAYTGPTNVTGGSLYINGNQSAATGTITVSSGALLGGTGTTGGAISVNGTLAPGGSGGTLTSSGSVTFAAGSKLSISPTDWSAPAGKVSASTVQINATPGNPLVISIDGSALTNFTESTKTFVIASTSGGVNGLSTEPGLLNYQVVPTGFATAPAGTWSLQVSAQNLELVYQPSVASGYSSWVSGYGLTGGQASADFDADFDGVPNLIEFIVGGTPNGPSDAAKLPVISKVAGGFEFVFRRTTASSSIPPVVQHSSTLAGTWTPAVEGVGGVVVTTNPSFYGAGIDQVIVRIPTTDSAHFARISASAP